MSSAPVRDPLGGHLLTPQNAALLLIDYQPAQLAGVHSMDRDFLVKNAVSTVRTGQLRQAGLSWRKTGTLRDMADRLSDGRLDQDLLSTLPDDELRAEKWRPYRSLATSYLFSAAFEPAEAPPAAQHRSA